MKNLPAMQEMQVQSLGQEDPLEEEMATCSSILAMKIPWKKEPSWAIVHGVAKNGGSTDATEQHTHFKANDGGVLPRYQVLFELCKLFQKHTSSCQLFHEH